MEAGRLEETPNNVRFRFAQADLPGCYYSVILPNATISWLNPFNLTAYGLPARCITLKTLRYHRASKDLLSGGWPTFRGGIHTR